MDELQLTCTVRIKQAYISWLKRIFTTLDCNRQFSILSWKDINVTINNDIDNNNEHCATLMMIHP